MGQADPFFPADSYLIYLCRCIQKNSELPVASECLQQQDRKFPLGFLIKLFHMGV